MGRASQRGLRASQRGLRASQRGVRASQGGRTDGHTEFLPILQDFVPSRGRCPKNGYWTNERFDPKNYEKLSFRQIRDQTKNFLTPSDLLTQLTILGKGDRKLDLTRPIAISRVLR